MNEIVSKLVSYAFIVTILSFTLNIVRLVYSDIHATNLRAASPGARPDAYLKLLNLQSELYFDARESYTLGREQTIGRANANGIPIKDPFLSKRHARIARGANGAYTIEDLGSKNGTRLNGERLEAGQYKLMDGDRVGVGQLSFLFVYLPAVEAAAQGLAQAAADDGFDDDENLDNDDDIEDMDDLDEIDLEDSDLDDIDFEDEDWDAEDERDGESRGGRGRGAGR